MPLLYVSLNNAKREELALLGSEFWLLAISVHAVSPLFVCGELH